MRRMQPSPSSRRGGDVEIIERVSDGDTIIAISANGTKLMLRLIGIDTPDVPRGEKPGQPFGEDA